MRRIFLLLIMVIAVIALGAGVFFFLHVSPGPAGAGMQATTAAVQVVAADSKYPPRDIPAGSKEFRSDLYDFSVLYPGSLTAAVRDEGSGAATITFQYDDKKEIEGFQIFIVPFAGGQITDARFKEDIPSGVRTNLKNITIAGATGASFYSTDKTLGDTAEVWFVRGGYLYEVTTFKEQAQWLADILGTWTFL